MKFTLFGIFSAIHFLTSCVFGAIDQSNCGRSLDNKMTKDDGQMSEPDQYPWIALLQYKTGRVRQYGCSGVLLNDRYVLTTASCLTNPKKKLTHVHLGEWNLTSTRHCVSNPKKSGCENVIVAGIEKTIPHEKFGSSDTSKSYDIGLIKLNRSVGNWQHICLPNGKPPAMKSFLTSGWGSDINFEYTRHVIKLQTRHLESVDKGKCATKLNRKTLQNDLACVQATAAKLACIGDSGGPLMTYNSDHFITIAGLLHSTSHICRERLNKPIIYTDVAQYGGWIESHVN